MVGVIFHALIVVPCGAEGALLNFRPLIFVEIDAGVIGADIFDPGIIGLAESHRCANADEAGDDCGPVMHSDHPGMELRVMRRIRCEEAIVL